MVKDVIQIPKDFKNMFTAFQNVVKEVADRPRMSKAYWDQPNRTLAATNGKCILAWNVPDIMVDKLPEEPCFIEYRNGMALVYETYEDGNQEAASYIPYRSAMPSKNLVETPLMTGGSLVSRKNKAAAACTYVSMATEMFFNPDLFGLVAPVIGEFSTIRFNRKFSIALLASPDDSLMFTVRPTTLSKPEIKESGEQSDRFSALCSLIRKRLEVKVTNSDEGCMVFAYGNLEQAFRVYRNGNYVCLDVDNIPIYMFTESICAPEHMYIAISGLIKALRTVV